MICNRGSGRFRVLVSYPDPSRSLFGDTFSTWLRGENPLQGNRLDRHGLLHEAEEKLTGAFRSSTVKSERELIQIVVQMLLANRAPVGFHQPLFKNREHSMDPWH